jgi:hypothetical protein
MKLIVIPGLRASEEPGTHEHDAAGKALRFPSLPAMTVFMGSGLKCFALAPE